MTDEQRQISDIDRRVNAIESKMDAFIQSNEEFKKETRRANAEFRNDMRNAMQDFKNEMRARMRSWSCGKTLETRRRKFGRCCSRLWASWWRS